jgi:hypothetical protein
MGETYLEFKMVETRSICWRAKPSSPAAWAGHYSTCRATFRAAESYFALTSVALGLPRLIGTEAAEEVPDDCVLLDDYTLHPEPTAMLRNLDQDFVDAIFAKYGRDVTSLHLSKNGLQKLQHIEQFADTLVKLNLSCNDIREVAPLASLHKLVELNLEQNEM